MARSRLNTTKYLLKWPKTHPKGPKFKIITLSTLSNPPLGIIHFLKLIIFTLRNFFQPHAVTPCIRETLNLLTDADSRTDTTLKTLQDFLKNCSVFVKRLRDFSFNLLLFSIIIVVVVVGLVKTGGETSCETGETDRGWW